jgi:hypothetical protein
VDRERGPLRLVSTTEELLDRKVAAPVSKIENTAVVIRHADHVSPSIRKKLAITSPTSGGRSVGTRIDQFCTATFKICCASISHLSFINPALVTNHSTFLMGAPWQSPDTINNGPCDETLGKPLPHNNIRYAWLINLFLGSFRKWDYLLIPT